MLKLSYTITDLRRLNVKKAKNIVKNEATGNRFGAKEFFLNKITTCAVALIAVIAPWIFYSCRTGHVFVDIVVFDGFCMTLFWLMIVNAAVAVALAATRLRDKVSPDCGGKKGKISFVAAIIVFVLTAVFSLAWIACLAVMGEESAPVAGRMLAESAPYALLATGVIFFALFFPVVRNGKARTIVIAAVAAAGIIGIAASVFPFAKYELISDPAVIDTGEGYSVVFAATDSGTGYVEYTYGGETYKIYDENGGRKVNARIHSVFVPYEHLNGNEYKVGSTRVIDELSYGGRTGKTVESATYAFRPITSENPKFLCVSDWHTRLKEAYKAAEHVTDYDGVILLGDAAPGLQYEEEAAEYIVGFGGKLSKGSMPIIYARGNHETRGKYASELGDALGIEEYYADIKVAGYRFIVLDSAEDKEDGHAEYGNMADYAAYRAKMVKWLEGLTSEPTEKIVVICHDYEICREKDLSERALGKLASLGAKVILCGHYHEVEFGQIGGIPYYIDGGNTNGGFIVSSIEFYGEEIIMTAVGKNGEIVGSYEIGGD